MGIPNPESDDFYQVLGVEKTASDAELKKAYRKLALKYHPDKATGDKAKAEERFKKVAEAYEVLSNKEKRQTYDQFGKAGLEGGAGGMPQGFSYEHANDIFEQFFGGRDPFEAFFSGGFGGMPGGMPGGVRGGPNVTFTRMGGGGGFDPMMGGMGFGGDMGPGGGMFFGGMPGMAGGMPRGASPFGMGGGPRQQPTYDAFTPGTPVILKSLKSAPQHNGSFATVVAFDRPKGRYVVEIEDYGTLSLKPENVQQTIKGVLVVGLVSRPHLNGKKGVVFDYDVTKDRCHTYVDGEQVAVKVESLVFPVGTVVCLNGLKNVQYNGRWGTIKEIDRVKQRYTIYLSNTEKLSVKFANVRP